MKKITLFALVVVLLNLTLKAQHDHAENISTTKTSMASPASPSQLLTSYFALKDALVNSDATLAATKAGEFITTANAIDIKSMSEAEQKAFQALQEKLVSDAKSISSTKDIVKQRDHFELFSEHFYTLAKAVKLSSAPVYQAFCPMKKASWLSSEKSIKNPYYGKQMLTCGNIKETLN